mgnify:CR=1 FL=1
MATPFYSTKYFKGQKALTTGHNLTPAELESYLGSEYAVQADAEERARAFALQKEQLNTQKEQFAIQTQANKEAAEGQERAATVAGVGTAISSTAQAALLYKMYSGVGAGAGASAGAGAGASAGAGAGASGATPGVIGTGGAALAGAGALYAHQDAVTKGTKYGEQISSATPWDDTTMEGRVANIALAPFEAAYGLSTAAIDTVTGGTVICTELHRQGYLSNKDLLFERIYGKLIDKGTHAGYLILARPIVEKMQKSKTFTKFIAIFGKAFAKEVQHIFNPTEYKGSFLGKIIIFFGKPLCRLVYALGGK